MCCNMCLVMRHQDRLIPQLVFVMLDACLCYAAHRMKISQARLGQKHSQETIERMRISQSEWWDRQKAMKKQALQQDSEAGLKQG